MTTETERRLERDELRLAHDTRVSVQRLRIALGERGRALDQGRDEVEGRVENVYTVLSRELQGIEARIDREIKAAVEAHPAWPWLSGIRGIGPGLAGQLLAMLPPPGPQYGVGTWYKVCGLVPELRTDKRYGEQWRLPRRQKPEPRMETCEDCHGEGCDTCDGEGEVQAKVTAADTTTYYPPLRRCLWNVSTSFLRAGAEGYYASVYYEQKARLRRLHEGEDAWPDGRSERVARWTAIKLFLSHLWEMWSKGEGIEYRRPYIVETDGRHHYIPPPEAG